MDEDEDTEQSTAETGSTAADEPPESSRDESADEGETAGEQSPDGSDGVDETPDSGTAVGEAAPDESADEDAESSASAHDAEAAAESPVGADLVERVSAYDEALGSEVEALVHRAFELKDEVARLRREIEELEGERDELDEEREDLKQRLVRKQADFKNFKERSKKKQARIRERATEDLVERLLPVRDNLRRALDQDEDADIRDGVEATLRDFDRVLEDENVEEITPEEGDDVDPQRHEVMVRVDSALPEGDIVELFRPGYEMADKVIQTAQVTVSNGADHEPEDEAVALGGAVEADDDEDDVVGDDTDDDEDDVAGDDTDDDEDVAGDDTEGDEDVAGDDTEGDEDVAGDDTEGDENVAGDDTDAEVGAAPTESDGDDVEEPVEADELSSDGGTDAADGVDGSVDGGGQDPGT